MPRLKTKNSIGFSSTTLGVRDRANTGGVDVGYVDQLTAADAYEDQRFEAANFLATGLPARSQQDDESYLLAVTTQAVYPGKARYRAVYGIDETVPLTVNPFSVADETVSGQRIQKVPRRYDPTDPGTSVGPGLSQRSTLLWTEDNSTIPVADYAGTRRDTLPIHVIRVPFVLSYWPLAAATAVFNNVNDDAVVINGQARAAGSLRFRGLQMRRASIAHGGTIRYSGYYVFLWNAATYRKYKLFAGYATLDGTYQAVIYLDTYIPDDVSFLNAFPHELGTGPQAP